MDKPRIRAATAADVPAIANIVDQGLPALHRPHRQAAGADARGLWGACLGGSGMGA